MSGSATLDTTKVADALVSKVDDIRSDVHAAMGTRPYRLYTVLRTSDGTEWGDDDGNSPGYTDVETEIVPAPKVRVIDLENRLSPGGLDEVGDIRVTEVSLSYTEDELYKEPVADNQQWMLKLVDGKGHSVRTRYYRQVRPPYPDWDKHHGWVLTLRQINMENA